MIRWIFVVVTLLVAMPWFTFSASLMNASSTVSVYGGAISLAVLINVLALDMSFIYKWALTKFKGATNEK